MLQFQNKIFYTNEKPTLILAGEVHYFRLDPSEWEDRLVRLKAAGMNCVATYIPWLLHEQTQGVFDFDGTTNSKLNIKLFLQLCSKHNLFLIVRPGPYVMAELKNDGIPFWVYEDYPHLIPKTWKDIPLMVPTLDYTHPDFLALSKTWYHQINKVLLPYKDSIIMYQIDNEIGMLAWVSNTPILTDFQCKQLRNYIIEHSAYLNHYNFINESNYADHFRNPDDSYVQYLLSDIGDYMRQMIKHFAITLRSYVVADGFVDILYAINIHGTGNGRGCTYPIGVSQLYETLKDHDFISGSDVYFDDFTILNTVDMYNCNEITDCLNGERPLTTLEFNAGDSNFGDNLASRVPAASSDFKTRLHLLQNNRLLNFYLFCGGINDRFTFSCHDGNDRFATTGHKHGFASLIDPLGVDSYLFPRLKKTLLMYQALNEYFAQTTIDYNDIAYAFIPNYYKNEYHVPSSELNQTIHSNINRFRDGVIWDGIGRAMMQLSYAYQAVDINQHIPKQKYTLVNLATYCEDFIQQRLVNYIKQGGTLIMGGCIPTHNLVGEPCTILKDYLEIKDLQWHSTIYPYVVSVVPDVRIDAYESHVGFAQSYEVSNADVLYHVYEGKRTCGFIKQIDAGRVVSLNFEIKCQPHAIEKLFEIIQLKPRIQFENQASQPGVFLQSCSLPDDSKFIYVMNYDEEDKTLKIHMDNQQYSNDAILLRGKDALILPFNINFNRFIVKHANSEIINYSESSLTFKNLHNELIVAIQCNEAVTSNYSFVSEANLYTFKIDTRCIEGDVTIEL